MMKVEAQRETQSLGSPFFFWIGRGRKFTVAAFLAEDLPESADQQAAFGKVTRLAQAPGSEAKNGPIAFTPH